MATSSIRTRTVLGVPVGQDRGRRGARMGDVRPEPTAQRVARGIIFVVYACIFLTHLSDTLEKNWAVVSVLWQDPTTGGTGADNATAWFQDGSNDDGCISLTKVPHAREMCTIST
ncbi:Aste57867_933 [Aphanomyces stellatus]|uniref:Aste57867_933 protein n=1 Tax=Aphanomyces stellatus TaxID=120398 RepID=A0A485K756_9STRA|nr:hypothetical protein As57867_000932 [Aphanomyces stellatus]VFT78156.1 Aste57867_933 [Aphanomyces stellatus]